MNASIFLWFVQLVWLCVSAGPTLRVGDGPYYVAEHGYGRPVVVPNGPYNVGEYGYGRPVVPNGPYNVGEYGYGRPVVPNAPELYNFEVYPGVVARRSGDDGDDNSFIRFGRK